MSRGNDTAENPDTRPLAARARDAAFMCVRAARCVEQAWAALDPRACGMDVWARLAADEPLAEGSLAEFIAHAGGVVRALRGLAFLADPDTVFDESMFDPSDDVPEDPDPPGTGGRVDIDRDNPEDRARLADNLALAGVAVDEDDISAWSPSMVSEAAAFAFRDPAAGDRPAKPDWLP